MCLVLLLTSSVSLACLPGAAAIDARVRAAMAGTRANGMAIAVIDDGRVAYVQVYGARNAKGEPLQTGEFHHVGAATASDRIDRSRAATCAHCLDDSLRRRPSRERRNHAPETATMKTAAAAANCHVREFTFSSFARVFALLGSSSSARA